MVEVYNFSQHDSADLQRFEDQFFCAEVIFIFFFFNWIVYIFFSFVVNRKNIKFKVEKYLAK